jgi:hypothetical protein
MESECVTIVCAVALEEREMVSQPCGGLERKTKGCISCLCVGEGSTAELD